MITLSINQLTVQLTIVQRNVNYQTMILLVSYKSSSIICTANDTISSAFPFEQHANPLISISAHDCALKQSTNSSTNNCSKKCQLPNHDLASLLQIRQHYMRLQMTELAQPFHLNSMQILSQYICA